MYDTKTPMTAERTLALYRQFYETNGPTLPAGHPSDMRFVESLAQSLDGLAGLILDSYGVIGLGIAPIENIGALFEAAARKNIPVVILTNGASTPASMRVGGYQSWGLPVIADDIISSRDGAYQALQDERAKRGALRVSYLGAHVMPFADFDGPIYGDEGWEAADIFAFLGATGWDEIAQSDLEAALLQTGAKLLVGNPDVSAPVGDGFSFEPGFWAMGAAKQTGCELVMTGKPYAPSFEIAFAALEAKAGKRLERAQVGMVGDSLHTDILGAKSFGLTAILLSSYGLLKGRDVITETKLAGIYPDMVARVL